GGLVHLVRQAVRRPIGASYRAGGRDCWGASGKDNTCTQRAQWQLGDLPSGYDHKYIYSHLGYNLKPLDLQAAIGLRQLDKLPSFIQARKRNWQKLRKGLADLEDVIDFSLPTHATSWNPSGDFSWDSSGCRSDCSWFGFKMSVRPQAGFSRTELVQFLDQNKIGNRMFFGGNLLRQPVFTQVLKESPASIRIIGDLSGADQIMKHAFFVGTYPGLSDDMIDHIIATIRAFCKR
ncbi:MAG: DegT/DnrJ/EryC1/StrS family aminotransferase, partial [Planctomycetota bacterium]